MADDLNPVDPLADGAQDGALSYGADQQIEAGSPLSDYYDQAPADQDELQGPAPTPVQDKTPVVKTPEADDTDDDRVIGDYDKRDTRVQFLQRVGQKNADLYSYVNDRKKSSDNKGGWREATPEEVDRETSALAKSTYQSVYGKAPKTNDPELLEFQNAYRQMYAEQRGVAEKEGRLVGQNKASSPGTTSEDRVADGLSQMGLDPIQAYDTYRRRLANRGKLGTADKPMDENEQNAAIADAMLADLKTVGVPFADLAKLRNQIDDGNWNGLRGLPTETSSTMGKSPTGAEADMPPEGQWDRLLQGATGTDAATTPSEPDGAGSQWQQGQAVTQPVSDAAARWQSGQSVPTRPTTDNVGSMMPPAEGTTGTEPVSRPGIADLWAAGDATAIKQGRNLGRTLTEAAEDSWLGDALAMARGDTRSREERVKAVMGEFEAQPSRVVEQQADEVMQGLRDKYGPNGPTPMNWRDVDGVLGAGRYLMDNMASSGAGTLTGMLTGAPGMVLTVAAGADDELRQKAPNMSAAERATKAMALGVAGGVLESIGLEKVLGKLSPTRLVAQAADGTLLSKMTQAGMSKAAASTLTAAIAEGTTETLQQALQLLVVAGSGGTYTKDEVTDQLVNSFLVGAGMGGGLRGSGELVRGAVGSPGATAPTNPEDPLSGISDEELQTAIDQGGAPQADSAQTSAPESRQETTPSELEDDGEPVPPADREVTPTVDDGLAPATDELDTEAPELSDDAQARLDALLGQTPNRQTISNTIAEEFQSDAVLPEVAPLDDSIAVDNEAVDDALAASGSEPVDEDQASAAQATIDEIAQAQAEADAGQRELTPQDNDVLSDFAQQQEQIVAAPVATDMAPTKTVPTTDELSAASTEGQGTGTALSNPRDLPADPLSSNNAAPPSEPSDIGLLARGARQVVAPVMNLVERARGAVLDAVGTDELERVAPPKRRRGAANPDQVYTLDDMRAQVKADLVSKARAKGGSEQEALTKAAALTPKQVRSRWATINKRNQNRARLADGKVTTSDEAMSAIRMAGQSTTVKRGTLIGQIAGFPNGFLPVLQRGTADIDVEASGFIGSGAITKQTALPSRGAPLAEQISGLQRAQRALINYKQMVSSITMSRFTGDVDPQAFAQRRSMAGMQPEELAMAKQLQTLVFRGSDAGRADDISPMDLALATDDQLLRWSTATTPDQINDLTTPLGRVGMNAARTAADMALVRGAASAMIDARTAEKRANRAIMDIDNALGALQALQKAGQGVDLMRMSDRISTAATQEQATLSLREQLEADAPDMLNPEATPISQLAAMYGSAANEINGAAKARDVLVRAYRSKLTNQQLFGNAWLTRRASRDFSQLVSVMQGVDANDPEVADAVDTARKVLGTAAAAEQIRDRNALAALRKRKTYMANEYRALRDARVSNPDLATRQRVSDREAELNRGIREINAQIKTMSSMKDKQIGEMLQNEFGMTADEALQTLQDGRAMAQEESENPGAIEAAIASADQVLGSVSLFTSVGPLRVDTLGTAIKGFEPDAFDPLPGVHVLQDGVEPTQALAPGEVMTVADAGLEPVANLIRTVSAEMNVPMGTVILPLPKVAMTPSEIVEIVSWLPEAARIPATRLYNAINSTLMAGDPMPLGLSSVRINNRTQVFMVDADLPPGPQAAVALHEFGHSQTTFILASTFAKSPKTFHQMVAAYEAQKGVTTVAGEREMLWPLSADTENAPALPASEELTAARRAYVNSFVEWIASRIGEQLALGRTETKGLVARVMQRLSDMWHSIIARITGDSAELSRLAVARAIQDSAREGIHPAMSSLAAFEPLYRDRDPDTAQMAATTRGRGLNDDEIASARQHLAPLTLTTGVEFVTNPKASARYANLFAAGNKVAYAPPTASGKPGVYVVNRDAVSSADEAVQAVREAMAMREGLAALVGRDGLLRLRRTLWDPSSSDLGALPAATRTFLGSLRAKATKAVRDNGFDPTPDTVVDEMLRNLAAQATNMSNTAQYQAGITALQAALQDGSEEAASPMAMRGILAAAYNTLQTTMTPSGKGLTRAQDESVTRLITQSMLAVINRNLQYTPRAQAMVETTGQKIWRTLVDYTLPFTRFDRVGQIIARGGNAAGEMMSRASHALNTRLRDYQAQLKRVRDAQYGVNNPNEIKEAFRKFVGRLGIKDVAEGRAVLNTIMAMRASIELNENNALVYGDLQNDTLNAQRLTIIQQADDAIRQVQGDNRHRTPESFARVRQIRADQMAQLRDLLLGPTSPDNRVKEYITKTRNWQNPFPNERWTDYAGISSGKALSAIDKIEAQYGGMAVKAFRESGLDTRLRALMDQTYQNRVMSGIYGASGELYVSRLGTQHYSPLRGLEVGEGEYSREDLPSGVQVYDSAAIGTGVRGYDTRLAETTDIRTGRNSAAVTDVLDTAMEDYTRSIREMTTNHINGALVSLASAFQALGVGGRNAQDNPLKAPLRASQPIPYFVFIDEQGNQHADYAPGRIPAKNPQIDLARQSTFPDGRTGTILHALPSGDYVVVNVNDPTIYEAMMFRFRAPTNNATLRFVQKALGEATRVIARTHTSWDPTYTTLRAVWRDLQENAVMLFSEQGVPLIKTAEILPRALKALPALERFFHSTPEKQQDLIRRALKNEKHPLHNFARRWQAGQVQTFEQQLELRTDVDELRRDTDIAFDSTIDPNKRSWAGRAVKVGQALTDNPVTRLFEAHADAMENAIRQATADVLENHLVSTGMERMAARDQAYETTNSIMDFAQRSDTGQALAPIQPFAQSAMTGLGAMFERRIWKGGKPPVLGGVTNDGRIDYSVWTSANTRQIINAINWPMLGSLAFAGAMNVLYTAGFLGMFGGDDDDDQDPETKKQIEKIKSKWTGPELVPEERNLILQGLDKAVRAFGGKEADNLDSLKINSILNGWLLPIQTEERQAMAPMSYGVVALGANIGQAVGLIMLGKDAGAVATGLFNAGVRNMTPLDTPFSNELPGLNDAAMNFMPEIVQEIYNTFSDRSLDGRIQTRENLIAPGAQATGPSNTPGMNDSQWLNEELASMAQSFSDAGYSLAEGTGLHGFAMIGNGLRRMVPDGLWTSNVIGGVPIIGGPIADSLKQIQSAMIDNARDGDPLFNLSDAGLAVGDYALRKGGFLKTDPAYASMSDYYEALKDPVWSDLANLKDDINERGRKVGNAKEILAASGVATGVVGYIQKQQGMDKVKMRQLYIQGRDAETPQEKQEIWSEIAELKARSDARYEAASQVLKGAAKQFKTLYPTAPK